MATVNFTTQEFTTRSDQAFDLADKGEKVIIRRGHRPKSIAQEKNIEGEKPCILRVKRRWTNTLIVSDQDTMRFRRTRQTSPAPVGP